MRKKICTDDLDEYFKFSILIFIHFYNRMLVLRPIYYNVQSIYRFLGGNLFFMIIILKAIVAVVAVVVVFVF